MAPRTAIPSLAGAIPPGETWLACAVSASVSEPAGAMPFRIAATQAGWRIEAPGYVFDLAR
jgi:hypothetical protein